MPMVVLFVAATWVRWSRVWRESLSFFRWFRNTLLMRGGMFILVFMVKLIVCWEVMLLRKNSLCWVREVSRLRINVGCVEL